MVTSEELKIIYDHAYLRRKIDELCLLVTLIIVTRLKMRDLLGWFNRNRNQRIHYLQNMEILEEYERVAILFPKKHQTYLIQLKKATRNWIGKTVTFEQIRKSSKKANIIR